MVLVCSSRFCSSLFRSVPVGRDGVETSGKGPDPPRDTSAVLEFFTFEEPPPPHALSNAKNSLHAESHLQARQAIFNRLPPPTFSKISHN